MSVIRYRNSRHWAVHDRAGRLICLTVYKKGGLEVERRLEEPTEMQHDRYPLFIGYAWLEEWMEHIDNTQPVLAMSLVEPGKEVSGMRTDRLLVVVGQIDGEGRVHYCRLRAADFNRCYGDPFDSDWKEREAAWHSLWELVREELTVRGFTLIRAWVAHPQNLRFLEGQAECAVFDRTSRRYRRKTVRELEGGREDATDGE